MTDDKLLIEQLANPKTQRRAFELVVKQYGEQLYWQIRRFILSHDDANDVLQNTFIKAWQGIGSFHGDSKLLTWLSRIAINESLDFLRRQKNIVTMSTDDEELGVANMLMADDYFDGDETEAQLQEAIAMLPEVQRTVFLLRYYDDMKYSDISKMLGTSEGALKASYHIAVKKISDFFKLRD
jgi:RNA polymerase sigma-70 factor (ECF subfamily)